MNLEQSTRIAVGFAREVARLRRPGLCTVCIDILAVCGVGITLLDGGTAAPLGVSSPIIGELEDAQFANGTGPCVDAFRSGRPVLAPRFDPADSGRWPSFVEMAQARGIRSAFAYPLSLAGAKIGVLSLYHDVPGDLSAAQHEDSVAIGEILTETILSLQDAAPRGALAIELEDAVLHRAEIHQASGMVASHLQIPVGEALARIRAHAFSLARPVRDVASDIVSRRLRLPDDRNP